MLICELHPLSQSVRCGNACSCLHASTPQQFFHLHRASAAVRALAAGPALAGAAAALLGARRVRLLQDAVFLKEPGFDATNWHSDLRMAPLDTNSYVTAWVSNSVHWHA